jgi:hypothetical protein
MVFIVKFNNFINDNQFRKKVSISFLPDFIKTILNR